MSWHRSLAVTIMRITAHGVPVCLEGPGLHDGEVEMKLLAWKTPKHGLAQETKEAGRAITTTYLNRHSTFLPSFSFHSSEIRARGFSGGIGAFPRLFFSGDRPGPCNWGCKRDLQPRKSMYLYGSLDAMYVTCIRARDAVTSFRVLFPREML